MKVFESRLLASATLVSFLCVSCEEKQKQVDTKAEPAQESEADKVAQESEPAKEEKKEDAPPPWSNRLTENSGFPCAVEKVLADSCRRCHWDPQENDAPFPMVKWEDVQEDRQGSPIWQLMRKQVEAELMPPLEEMVSPPVEPLTPDQKKTLLAWLEAGAEKTVEECP